MISLIRCTAHPDRLCTHYWRGIRYCEECWAALQAS